MSHTFKAENGTRFHHDNDGGGLVRITPPGGAGALNDTTIPLHDMMEFVASIARQARIEELENRDWPQIIYGD